MTVKLIDVGASGGAQKKWKKIKNLQVIGFEPDERSFLNLKQEEAHIYINKALYRDSREVDLYLTRSPQLSSFSAPNDSFLKHFPEKKRFDIIGSSKINVSSLDEELKKHNIENIDFIKLDTQGTELPILEGATKTLKTVFGLEIEVEFNQMYQNQFLFSDVDKFVRSLGFQLFDLRPCYWKREIGKKYGGMQGQMIFADALYFRSLDSMKWTKEKILNATAIALLYGYADYAVAIFEQNKNLFTKDETSSFYKKLKKAMLMPHFPGKSLIARMFKKLYNLFRCHTNGWGTGGEFLGNLE